MNKREEKRMEKSFINTIEQMIQQNKDNTITEKNKDNIITEKNKDNKKIKKNKDHNKTEKKISNIKSYLSYLLDNTDESNKLNESKKLKNKKLDKVKTHKSKKKLDKVKSHKSKKKLDIEKSHKSKKKLDKVKSHKSKKYDIKEKSYKSGHITNPPRSVQSIITAKIINLNNNKVMSEKQQLIPIKKDDNVNNISNKIMNNTVNNTVVNAPNSEIDTKYNDNYLLMMSEFTNIYKTTIYEVLENPKIEYRYFCYRYLSYIRNIELPEISLNKEKEAVLIEFRIFPHLEFILRNAIIKIGSEWSYSVICGNLNYDYVVELCKNISENIKVIKVNHDNLNQSTYSELFATVEFWNLFVGNKLLIYQEDSCIFKSNINDFIEWDYIGAPWSKSQNDNELCVGNGGFTLRTKQCMIDVINTVSLEDTQYNSSTLEYMKNCGMTKGPEDVYFSLNMLKYNIGKVADWDSASNFSTENIKNLNSLGGHNFWLSDTKWKNRLYKEVVIQYRPTYYMNDLEHRGGWKLILQNLIDRNFYNSKSDVIFFDVVERYFIWNKNYMCTQKWAGIVHCTQTTPDYLNIVNIQELFKNKNFISSLSNCLFIISLSNYVAEYLREQFLKLNIKVNVIVLKHPVDDENIKMFDYNEFISNNNKQIIQIGQQLRKMTSIYLLEIPINYKKIWLTGTTNENKCKVLLNKEISYLKIDNIKINLNTVDMKYVSVDEFDKLLVDNVVFVDLFDASANNTVLECIIRNTPIIINKIPAVVEYLGEEYPLYFKNLKEVSDMLYDNNSILKAHEYLKNLNKEEFKINYFIKKIINNMYTINN